MRNAADRLGSGSATRETILQPPCHFDISRRLSVELKHLPAAPVIRTVPSTCDSRQETILVMNRWCQEIRNPLHSRGQKVRLPGKKCPSGPSPNRSRAPRFSMRELSFGMMCALLHREEYTCRALRGASLQLPRM